MKNNKELSWEKEFENLVDKLQKDDEFNQTVLSPRAYSAFLKNQIKEFIRSLLATETAKAATKERHKYFYAYRARKIAVGICVVCTKPIASGSVRRCEEHLAKNREWNRKSKIGKK